MNNGVGPGWFHPKIRALLTKFSSLFFNEASWDAHDVGYATGKPDRYTCDFKFIQAMLRDASLCQSLTRVLLATFVAWIFWFLVRCFGWIRYRPKSSG